MPVARFKMPDGRIARFEVPEGTTAENAQQLIEQHLSSQVQVPKQEEAQAQYEGRNISDMSAPSKFLTGVGNTVMDLGRGAKQIYGDPQANEFGGQQDIERSRKLRSELNKSGAGQAGDIFGSVAPILFTGGSSFPTLAAQGATMGALQPTSGNENRLMNMLASTGGSLAGGAIVKGLGKLAGGFTPSKDAASLMAQGIQPTLGQGIEQGVIGKGIRKMEESSTSAIPFVGGLAQSARDRATKEWTQRAIKEAEIPGLGVTAQGEVGHEAMANLKKGFEQAYTKVLENKTISIKPQLGQDIVNAIDDPALFLNPAERGTVIKGVQGLLDKISPDNSGKYLASDIFKIESKLKDQVRALPKGDPKAQVLNQVRSIISDYRESNLPAQTGKVIQELNSKYANFVRLKRAAGGVGAEHGEFTPAQLYNSAAMLGKGSKETGNALMQKLAGEGKAILGSKTGDSGTASRAMMNRLLVGSIAGGAGGAAAYTGNVGMEDIPAMAALALLAKGGSTRAAQKLLLGGYSGQKAAERGINRLLTPMLSATAAKYAREY
jgi:hypothetical protein